MDTPNPLKRSKSSNEELKNNMHGRNAFCKLNEFRKKNMLCDFVICVGTSNMPVHQLVIAATSPYYEDMLIPRKTERILDDVPNATKEAVLHCIEYMYSGETLVDLKEAENILFVASYMKLDELIRLWFRKFAKIMNVNNCWEIRRLSKKFDHKKTKKDADLFICNNIEDVADHKEFLWLKPSEILNIIEKVHRKVFCVWKHFSQWINHDLDNRRETTTELVEKFLSGCRDLDTLGKLMNDPLIKTSQNNIDVVAKCFSETVISNSIKINTKNLVTLIGVSSLFNDEKFTSEISKLISIHLPSILDQEEFLNLEFNDARALLESSLTNESTEKNTWVAFNRWIKQTSSPKRFYLELLKGIKVERFSNQFIREVISKDPFIKKIDGCFDYIIEILTRPVEKAIPATGKEKTSAKKGLFAAHTNESRQTINPFMSLIRPDQPSTSKTLNKLESPSASVALNLLCQKEKSLNQSMKVLSSNFILIINDRLERLLGFCPDNKTFYNIGDIPTKVKNYFPLPLFKHDFFQVAVIKEKLYLYCRELFICREINLQMPSDSVQWEVLKRPSQSHSSESKVIVFQSKIYIIDSNSEFYCPETCTWTSFSMGNFLTVGYCLASTPGQIYKIGGALKTQATQLVGIWNNANLSYNRMLCARKSASATSSGEKVYVFGGIDEHGRALISAECFDPRTNNWSMLTNMSKIRLQSVSCSFESKIYVVGGGSIEEYDIEQKRWSTVASDQLISNRFVAVGATLGL